MEQEPKSLQEAMVYFNDQANCREYLMARRWPDGVTCPTCGSKKVTFSLKFNRWQCGSHHAKRQFTIKTGTVFEDSALGLDKWLLAMWMIINCKNGISSYEIARDLAITQKSAWFVLHRLREVMGQDNDGGKLSGEVEADETFVGGKVRNMHRRSKRKLDARNDGSWGKAIVIGLLEREGRVKAAVAPNRRKHELHTNIESNVEPGSKLYTDDFNGYNFLPADFQHEFVNHLQSYVKGRVHTSGMENFWSLLKRGLKGTYVSVDPAHLQAYVDEQVFRFNNRLDSDGGKLTDSDRFDTAIRQIVGKRLTWNKLIGKEDEQRQVVS
ncbi:MAG: IS1595 family transposase [Acidobacteriota bacterium]